MNIASQLLSKGAPDATAVVAGGRSMTYAELRDAVDRVARSLIARGVRKQEPVGLWSENSPFFIAAYLGIIRAGLVAVPLQTDASAETLEKIREDVGITTLLVSNRHQARLRTWLVETEAVIMGEADWSAPVRGNQVDFPDVGSMQDLAALMFTSGSTGQPKGVMVTHGNIECNTLDIISYMGLDASDRAMVVLPFHYCFGLSVLHTHLAVGGAVVLNNSFLYPEKVLQEMQSRECTGLAGVPSTYQILLRRSRFREMEFPRLRWLQQAGGKLPNAYIEEILQAFPAVRFYLMYGQTEGTARLSYLPPERLHDKLGSIGRGLPSTKLEVLQPDGSAVVPGSNEVGEIVASGGNIALGYWNDPRETARYFKNGKLYTGDLARVDEEGFIYVVEREREMIKCGGNRVSTREIEDVIAEIPDVVEVAVVGASHSILGEAGVAFVTLKAGARETTANILDHCRRRLPAFKVPDRVFVLPRLPHGSNGKVLKSKLKEMASAEPGRPDTVIARENAQEINIAS